VHRPGKTHLQADALSRLSTHRKADEDDNPGQTVLKPQHFTRLAASHFVNPLEERIRNVMEREVEVVKGLAELKMVSRTFALSVYHPSHTITKDRFGEFYRSRRVEMSKK
jgi:hypothetical protein